MASLPRGRVGACAVVQCTVWGQTGAKDLRGHPVAGSCQEAGENERVCRFPDEGKQ